MSCPSAGVGGVASVEVEGALLDSALFLALSMLFGQCQVPLLSILLGHRRRRTSSGGPGLRRMFGLGSASGLKGRARSERRRTAVVGYFEINNTSNIQRTHKRNLEGEFSPNNNWW